MIQCCNFARYIYIHTRNREYVTRILINQFSLSFAFAGKSGLASAGNRESQHGGAYAAHLRRGAAANLHPHASGLVSAIRQQWDLPEGGQNEQQQPAQPEHWAGAQWEDEEQTRGDVIVIVMVQKRRERGPRLLKNQAPSSKSRSAESFGKGSQYPPCRGASVEARNRPSEHGWRS